MEKIIELKEKNAESETENLLQKGKKFTINLLAHAFVTCLIPRPIIFSAIYIENKAWRFNFCINNFLISDFQGDKEIRLKVAFYK